VSEKEPMISGLVSVVICTWNNWPDVEMTAESALHQSYQPIEVIIVDNSSIDVTPEEVPKRFGRRVRYIRQPNRDTAGAYNTGFDVARGEFIQFLDGDDVLAPNKIEKQVEVFQANPELDIVYGDIRPFQTSAGVTTWDWPPTENEEDMLLTALSTGGGICTDLGTLFRRRVLERVGPWDETLYVEDTDYLLRTAWAGCRFGHCSGGPMGFARVRSSAKTQHPGAMQRGLEAVWEKALGYVTREPYRSLVATKLARHRFNMAFSKDRVTKREAWAMLDLARTTHPQAISAPAYAVAWASIALPGGTALVRSPWLRPIRRFLARLLRYPIPQTIGSNRTLNLMQ
jgi:glycosyltransferase involved in cell wall biosynthesis